MVSFIVINVTNSMACRVYRDIKFGRIAETTVASSTTPSLPFRAASRDRGDIFVNVGSATTYDESNGTSSRSTKMELHGMTSFKSNVETDGEV